MEELVYNVLLAVITALIGVVTTQLIPYLKAKQTETTAKLRQTKWSWTADIIDAAVRAVEQTAKGAIHGEDKKQAAMAYTKSVLQKSGITMSDEQISTLIEAAVQAMNAQAITIEEPVLEDTAEAEEEEATVPVCSGDPKSE